MASSKEIVDPCEIPSTEVHFQHNDYRQVLNCERYPKVKEKYNIRFPQTMQYCRGILLSFLHMTIWLCNMHGGLHAVRFTTLETDIYTRILIIYSIML